MKAPHSIVIVGAGLAGSRCAETLRAEGFDGELVVLGDEPLPPYERPALSKEFLAGVRAADELCLRPATFWQEHGIELRLGQRVVRVDCPGRTATTKSGDVFRWDALVLATGARPRRLPFTAPPGVHELRTLAHARALRSQLVRGRTLIVVGAGFVGAEVASTARSLGVEVTMLETGGAPFERVLGRELGELLCTRYRIQGVVVKTRVTATAFGTHADGRVRSVALANGDEVPCDVALVAVGVNAEIGLVSSPTKPVYACGDALGGPGHWTSAAASGANVARDLLGLDPLPRQPPFFWSDQFGLRIQLVGDPIGADAIEVSGSEDSFVARYWSADGRLVAALAANRPETVASFRRELAFAA